MSDAFAPPSGRPSADYSALGDVKPVLGLGTVLSYMVLAWTGLSGLLFLLELALLGVGYSETGDYILIASGLLGLVILPLFIACAVVWCVWAFRISKNLRELELDGLQYKPGWAVGWWFVPFANLLMPYRVVLEQFTFSDPDDEMTPAPSYVLPWWIVWVVGGILGNVSLRLTLNGMDELAVMLDPVVSIFNLINGGLAFMLVRDLTQRHTDMLVRRGRG